MIADKICGTMLTVRDGYLECPYCKASRVQRVRQETVARGLQVFCRKCKHEIIVDMQSGQCYLSRGQ